MDGMYGAPKGITRHFLRFASCFARKPGLGILPRPLSGKKVHWTFFFSASPLWLAPSGPAPLRGAVQKSLPAIFVEPFGFSSPWDEITSKTKEDP
ncbi:MAG TPA: hypothetical protein VLB06_00135 [Sulfuricaulis sp.]|nr:hypothetical protein [Sulfuricaulis sp.]